MEKQTSEKIQTWAAGISQSDRTAFDRFFRLMYPKLVRFACRYTKSKATACDIVQDVFVNLWKKRREIDPEKSLKSYAYQSVRNRSLNYLRDHSNETVGIELYQHPSEQPDHHSDTDNQQNDEMMNQLESWVNDLPDRQQEAFKLSRFDGLQHNEIADVMDVSVNTVNNHLVSALNSLRERYQAYQNEVNQNRPL